jgi:uncharacterized protein
VQIENAFDVAAPIGRVWAYLLDVERVTPCMPGAELTEVVDDRTWKGKVRLKLGPVSLAFAGTVSITERDDDARRVVLSARGTEQRGKGAADASVTGWLESSERGTTVKMLADIRLTGPVAQLGRGLLPEVSRALTQEFADCLHESMAADEDRETGAAGVGPASRPAPIGGIRLGVSAIRTAVARFFARLFGRSSR